MVESGNGGDDGGTEGPEQSAKRRGGPGYGEGRRIPSPVWGSGEKFLEI